MPLTSLNSLDINIYNPLSKNLRDLSFNTWNIDRGRVELSAALYSKFAAASRPKWQLGFLKNVQSYAPLPNAG